MTVLPVVARELKVRSTQPGFFWLRLVLAGFAILSCLQWFNSGMLPISASDVGRASFHMLAQIAFVVAISAAVLTADCVSNERREGTLGLLFLTTLKSRDVALGKLAACGLTAIYALVGFAPVLMLPLVVGGVTGGEVLRVFVALLNLMFVSLAAGLFVSMFARTQFSAILRSAALLAFVIGSPWIVQIMMRDFFPIPAMFSPAFAFWASDDRVNTAAAAKFWPSVGAVHLEGWTLIALAVLALRRNWREIFQARAIKAPPPQVRGLIGAPRIVLGGEVLRKRAFAPVARAVLRMPGQQGIAWLAALISLVGSLIAAFAMRGLGSIWAATTVTTIFGFASSALFAFVAGRFFFEARRSGELELLLVTPAGAKGILREQRFALVRMLRGPFFLTVIGTVPVAVSGVSASDGNEVLRLALGLCHIVGVATGVMAICWVGMWFGARVNHSLGVIGWSVGLVELLPVALAYLVPVLLFGWFPELLMFWFLIVPVLLVLKNLLFIALARRRLHEMFRASDGFHFARLFRAALLPTEMLPADQTQSAQ